MEAGLVIERIATEASFKSKAYAALKEAVTNLDLYRGNEPIMLDERELSDRLGVSRTPIREAVAMLEQEGFVRTVPRRGILVLRKSKREIVEMIQAWAALESMAARLVADEANLDNIQGLRRHFDPFLDRSLDGGALADYSAANVDFHQALIRLSGSGMLVALTDNLFLHVRAIRRRAMYVPNRADGSLAEHLAIIDALERRDVETAERLVREHSLALAARVEQFADLD